MNKVTLTDFTGGFSQEIRADLLPDNVCQMVENCEINKNGLLESRHGFEHTDKKFGLEVGESVVWMRLWNSYYRLTIHNVLPDNILSIVEK